MKYVSVAVLGRLDLRDFSSPHSLSRRNGDGDRRDRCLP